jgi:drug/metabolite transporter (DMT)-like permease
VSRSALAAGLVAVGLWGLAPVATRAAVGHLSPLPMLTIRMLAAALLLAPWAGRALRGRTARQAGRLAAAGLLGLVGYNLPVAVGLQWLPAAPAGLLLATEPVWVLLIGRVFLAERGGVRPWIGSAVALAGVAALAGPQAIAASTSGGYHALAGMAAVLAGTMAFGAYTIVLRPLSAELGAVPATAASAVAGTLPYLALSPLLTRAGLGHLDAAAWAEIAFLAIGSTAAGMLLWNVAVLAGGAAQVSTLLYLEPVISVLGAAVFLGERPGPATIGGGLLILAGVAIASVRVTPPGSGSPRRPAARRRPPEGSGRPRR